MTQTEINDCLISLVHQNFENVSVTPEARRAVVCSVKEAFMVGTDDGKAIILAAVDNMIAPRVATDAAAAIMRTLDIVARWCAIKTPNEGLRSYTSGPTVYTQAGRQWRVTCYGGMTQRHFFGVDQADALAQFAQWADTDMVHDGKTEPNNEIPVQS